MGVLLSAAGGLAAAQVVPRGRAVLFVVVGGGEAAAFSGVAVLGAQAGQVGVGAGEDGRPASAAGRPAAVVERKDVGPVSLQPRLGQGDVEGVGGLVPLPPRRPAALVRPFSA